MSMSILISSLGLSFFILVPLGVKWELEKKIVVPAALIIGMISWVITTTTASLIELSFYAIFPVEVIVISATSVALLSWRFFRDPERIPPDNENAILSPADGQVIYVKEIKKGEIPFSDKNGRKFLLKEFIQSDVLASGGYLIGIAMNYLDVHVNRAPIGGRISLLKHIKGLFISLKKKEAVIQNERVFTVIENGYLKVGIVQIASRMVRKIVPYLTEGNEVERGQRIGMIRFGSQVDLIIPHSQAIKIETCPGEKLKAGLSIVATFY